MNTFPSNSDGAPFGQSVRLHTDARLQIPAPILDQNGIPIAQSRVVIINGIIPLFQSTSAVLYARDQGGNVVTFYPTTTAAGKPTVTGTSVPAALTSLLSGLNTEGTITDSTAVVKPTVTGATAPAALASLLAGLVTEGLVTDTTTIPAAPAVTGSKASGAALASLLTTLASLGLIVDSTTA